MYPLLEQAGTAAKQEGQGQGSLTGGAGIPARFLPSTTQTQTFCTLVQVIIHHQRLDPLHSPNQLLPNISRLVDQLFLLRNTSIQLRTGQQRCHLFSAPRPVAKTVITPRRSRNFTIVYHKVCSPFRSGSTSDRRKMMATIIITVIWHTAFVNTSRHSTHSLCLAIKLKRLRPERDGVNDCVPLCGFSSALSQVHHLHCDHKQATCNLRDLARSCHSLPSCQATRAYLLYTCGP